jgi:hypothetical protein
MSNQAVLTMNGKITLSQIRRLYAHGKYERRLVISSQNEREFCDLTMTRDQVEELIWELRKALNQELI